MLESPAHCPVAPPGSRGMAAGLQGSCMENTSCFPRPDKRRVGPCDDVVVNTHLYEIHTVLGNDRVVLVFGQVDVFPTIVVDDAAMAISGP